MRVVCISGKAQHGKDTTASFIKKELEKEGDRVLVAHYGDLVKYVCKTFLGWDGEKDEKGRTLLQHVGTDVVRTKDNDYWVRFISDMLHFFGEKWDFVLIPDSRFPNEIEYLKKDFDVIHLRVIREKYITDLTAEQSSHSSETSLDSYVTDDCLINFENLDEYEELVKAWVHIRLKNNY